MEREGKVTKQEVGEICERLEAALAGLIRVRADVESLSFRLKTKGAEDKVDESAAMGQLHRVMAAWQPMKRPERDRAIAKFKAEAQEIEEEGCVDLESEEQEKKFLH